MDTDRTEGGGPAPPVAGARVSVVVPTAGRPAVRDAVASALTQTAAPLEVIVVVDQAGSGLPPSLDGMSGRIRVFHTGGIGANAARMRGVAEARGEIVAFLDDDDVWAPRKLERQLSAWRSRPRAERYSLVSCRLALIDQDGVALRTLPARTIAPQETVASYLFRRRSLAYGEGLLHTSTLMCDRALIELEPWDRTLARHQDWDWVLRIGQRTDVALSMCPEILAGVTVADARSISMSADWRASLAWLERRTDQLTPRERGDFLLCHTATIAFRAGNRRGGFAAAGRAVRCGRPGPVAWLVWLLHLISPRLLDRAAAVLRSAATRGAATRGPAVSWRRPSSPREAGSLTR
jgi:glycosyltransferase involved in cell wall biosynthesis